MVDPRNVKNVVARIRQREKNQKTQQSTECKNTIITAVVKLISYFRSVNLADC